MDALIDLLKQEGVSEDSVNTVVEELQKFKDGVLEEAKDLQSEAIQEELKSQLEEKGAALEEEVQARLDQLQEESKLKQEELSSRVSVYLESKTNQLKQEAYQQVIEEGKNEDSQTLLERVASLVMDYYQEGSESDDSTAELESLKEEMAELKEERSKLKLEGLRAQKQIKLLEESLSVNDDDDEVGGEDLLEEGQDQDLDTEDNNDTGDSFDIVSLTARNLKR